VVPYSRSPSSPAPKASFVHVCACAAQVRLVGFGRSPVVRIALAIKRAVARTLEKNLTCRCRNGGIGAEPWLVTRAVLVVAIVQLGTGCRVIVSGTGHPFGLIHQEPKSQFQVAKNYYTTNKTVTCAIGRTNPILIV
jgi:hypothetical protein